MEYDIRDRSLAEMGRRRITWAARHMPVLGGVAHELAVARPLAGLRIGASLHITPETAVLMRALRAGGAAVVLSASNPLSTRDDVCAALVEEGIAVFAHHGENLGAYGLHLERALAHDPHIVMDDGADLIVALHRRPPAGSAFAGVEETTTGVVRARALAGEGLLRFPVIAVNDTPTKRLFDNRYGTGQNTIDGILRATNTLLAGAPFVVAGYGWCGRGIAMRARGMGAQVIVCEVDATRALEASMEGFAVLPMREAAVRGEVFVTATGMAGVIGEEHFALMRDGAILANSGHFDVEIDVAALRRLAVAEEPAREHVTAFRMADGRVLYLLAEGRLVGQAAAEASPAAVMDLSFAGQALSTVHLAEHGRAMAPGVYDVPSAIDERVAARKLAALGITIDTLSASQRAYARDWQLGTAATA
jgi:adenosylhomocysteinase